jgi:hypothetical protein
MAQSTVSRHGWLLKGSVNEHESTTRRRYFSHVVKLSTLRIFLAIATKWNMHIHSADIETAFRSTDLQEKIYMRQPKGTQDGTPRVMSIYGLKQASREWYELFH